MELASIYSVQTDYIQSLVRYEEEGGVYGFYQGMTFHSVFQPIVDSMGQVLAFEGLVRIKDDRGNSVNPGHYFSSMLPGDESNVVATLLCGKLHSINLAHTEYRHSKLFINVSPSVFTLLANDRQSIEHLMRRLKKLGLVSAQIIYEITEFEESDLARILQGKAHLEQYGILTALDDYGACYSTRKRALKIRAPYLKIDRSYISDVSFVREAVAVAQSIGAKTIAEGVETREQFEMCGKNGVNYFQGYWIAKPMTSQRLQQYQPLAL
ncbi:EAL domain-containing protein [Vibrio lamellibrachiae]|uniref:EAL domain-containing protein n=1 Tax=Vibrio lamellibrachiae TaxID=2910253 RepID=UPI003D0E33A5